VLWAKTLSQTSEKEQRKVAAFKLSQYSQPIFQEDAIKAITQCMKDPDEEIKVLCAKAMRRAGTQKDRERIRKVLLTQFDEDPSLRSTLVRTFIDRKDDAPLTHDRLLEAAKTSQNPDEIQVYLQYFENFGSGADNWVTVLTDLYKKNDSLKLKNAIVKTLAARGLGQQAIITLFAECVDSRDTPLVLNCLSGLEQQAKGDEQSRTAVRKTLQSEDPDVLLASLDVIMSLGEASDAQLATRLINIIEEVEDPEIQEKAVLALGVCGDHSEPVVEILRKMLESKTNEASQIASALVIGKQANLFPNIPRTLLSKCATESPSVQLKTACSVGLLDLDKTVPPVARTTAEQKQLSAKPQEKPTSAKTP